MEKFEEIRKQLEKEEKAGSYIFMPSAILNADRSYFMPVIEKITLTENDIYKAQNKYRIRYEGLLKLALAAMIKWSVSDTRRTDDRSDKMYVSFMAVGGIMDSAGEITWHKAEKDIDLEVIEMELEDQYNANWEKVKNCTGQDKWKKQGHETKENFVKAMVRRDLIQHRKNKFTKAESGAKARVIRSILKLQGTYTTQKQLTGTSFVMVHFVKNTNHPEVKKMLQQALPTAQNMIYGSGAKQISFFDKEAEDIIDTDVIKFEEPEPEEKHEKPSTHTAWAKGTEDAEPEENSNTVDFENCDATEQVKILQDMCKKKGEEWDVYEGKANEQGYEGVLATPQDWRTEFFQYLNGGK